LDTKKVKVGREEEREFIIIGTENTIEINK
jgi:hypothetical protein